MSRLMMKKTWNFRVSAVSSVLALTAPVLLAGCGSGLLGSLEEENADETPSDEVPAGPCDGSPVLTSGQAASLVIGKSSLTSSDSVAPEDGGFDDPFGVMSIINGALFVPDYGANRIAVYDPVPTADGAALSFVVGQPDNASTSGGATRSVFDGVEGALAHGDKFYTLEYSNSRILGFNAVPTASGAAADFAVAGGDFGEADAWVPDTACSATGLQYIEGFTITPAGKLIVADTGRNRVLIWNSVPTEGGVPADLVLGQPDKEICNGAPAENSSTGSTLAYPSFVWSDDTRLVVTSYDEHRVLIWNSFPTEDGQAADVVVGQANFTANQSNRGAVPAANTLNSPYAAIVHDGKLVVADANNNRVLIYNSVPSTDGASADLVLGQSDTDADGDLFDENSEGDPDTGLPTASSLNYPNSVLMCKDQLFVMDRGSARVVVFETPAE